MKTNHPMPERPQSSLIIRQPLHPCHISACIYQVNLSICNEYKELAGSIPTYKVHLEWILSYGIPGNKKADDLAKGATKESAPATSTLPASPNGVLTATLQP